MERERQEKKKGKCDFWPTMLIRERVGWGGYHNSDPGGNHYYVGCLGQICVLLPE